LLKRRLAISSAMHSDHQAQLGIAEFAAIRCDGSTSTPSQEALTAEAPLQICINGEPFTVTMRTPGQDDALVRGLFYADGIANLRPGVGRIELSENQADVCVPPVYLCEDWAGQRSLLANSSCGLCGVRNFTAPDGERLALEAPFSPLRIPQLMADMRSSQALFTRTGSAHAAAIFDAGGALLSCHEDIGRHNAVDKVVGDLLGRDSLTRGSLLAVSGRVSYELVQKAWRAELPILLAVSAPSSFAVEMGERLGVAVIGFCREHRATVYSCREHVAV
jgi:FdhD protein